GPSSAVATADSTPRDIAGADRRTRETMLAGRIAREDEPGMLHEDRAFRGDDASRRPGSATCSRSRGWGGRVAFVGSYLRGGGAGAGAARTVNAVCQFSSV